MASRAELTKRVERAALQRKLAEQALADAASDAKAADIPVAEIATAAGFKTRKAVYDLLKRMGVATLLIAVLVPASAGSAVAAEDGAPDYPYQQWTDAARVPTPTLPVTVVEQQCPTSADSCLSTELGPDLISPIAFKVYLNPVHRAKLQRGLFLHELGHAFDIELMSTTERRKIARLLGLPLWSRPDFAHSGSAERFAWRYSDCAAGRHGSRRFDRSCALIRSL